MRKCSPSTITELSRLSELPTKPAWLKLAVYDATHDKPVSRRREERMIIALGLPPLPRLVETVACPDCGNVHNGGRCNGKQVVTLNRVQRTPPPPWVREATENLRRLLEAKATS